MPASLETPHAYLSGHAHGYWVQRPDAYCTAPLWKGTVSIAEMESGVRLWNKRQVRENIDRIVKYRAMLFRRYYRVRFGQIGLTHQRRERCIDFLRQQDINMRAEAKAILRWQRSYDTSDKDDMPRAFWNVLKARPEFDYDDSE